ncbi:betaine-aldehyde dehydrogenase [Mycobacterium gallinarum]|uniref:Putative succinate-semialdehyde dehydrogenase [NADP(+)] 2 n=1 Tax=Mycobacterium gallinarum TaxID=39689 RepID=A0A9W4AXW9_9MYCO|nr:aldehyde dehydrogenase family protein [Mycobacterium gallinarum]BBY90420.1 betaine-aldehyde dehydrogenase [Mycobacterium gallinarum]
MTAADTAIPDRLRSGPLLIGGDHVTDASGGTYQHVYPGTGQVNFSTEIAGEPEIELAVSSGVEAQREWASWTVDKRRAILMDLADAVGDHQDELSLLNVHDYGVPRLMSANGVLTERFLRYYAGYIDKPLGTTSHVEASSALNITEHEPFGVVGVITPWNGPLVVIGLAVAPALAAGNAVVLKPSELAPLAPVRFGEICLEAGLPAGLVNVVTAGADGGQALVRHPGVSKIHFTGGQKTARSVIQAASQNLTPVTAELGGNAAMVVFDDADIDAAASTAAFQGPLGQSGQSCACASRILIQDDVYEEFVEKFLATISSVTIGDPLRPDVMFGPVVSESAAERIVGVIDDAVNHGWGKLLSGGHRMEGELAEGFFVEPTVFSEVNDRSPLVQQETFGPVVAVTRFTHEAEAVRTANDTVYGLNAYVFTSNLNRAHRVARKLEAGSVWVNSHSDIEPQSPYGGYKQSGFGRSGGLQGLQEFLQVKNIRIAAN